MSSSILIFGASGRLGSVVADCFQKHQWRVLGTGWQKKPATPDSIQLDLTQKEAWSTLDDWIKSIGVLPDVVLSCIGQVNDSLVLRMSDETWQKVLDVNLTVVFRMTRWATTFMTKRRSGHILVVSSWGGRVGRIGQANYVSAKAGLLGLVQSVAREYAPRHIRVNGIIPGVFESPMTQKLTSSELERLWDGAALCEFADLQETAELTYHLSNMKGVTGQIFQLDGRIGRSW